MECFVITVNGWKPLTIITKWSILDAAAVLDPLLVNNDSIGNYLLSFIDKKHSEELDTDIIIGESVSLQVMLTSCEINCFQEIYRTIRMWEKSIPKMVKLIKILLVNPTTSWAPEQSFSTARRLKAWPKSTMRNTRFDFLSILHIHNRYYYIIWPLFLLHMYTVFTFQIYLWKICFVLKISFFILSCYFISTCYGFIPHRFPLAVYPTCYTRKFDSLAHKTVSSVLHQARKLRNKHHLITVRFLYTSRLLKIL